jgi:hypothetical protein
MAHRSAVRPPGQQRDRSPWCERFKARISAKCIGSYRGMGRLCRKQYPTAVQLPATRGEHPRLLDSCARRILLLSLSSVLRTHSIRAPSLLD